MLGLQILQTFFRLKTQYIMEKLRIAIQKSGRLSEKSLNLLKEAGISSGPTPPAAPQNGDENRDLEFEKSEEIKTSEDEPEEGDGLDETVILRPENFRKKE